MRKIILFLILVFSCNLLKGQPTLEWVAMYQGPGQWHDTPEQILLDGDNIYIFGGSFGNGTFSDYCLVKYNQQGVEQLVRRYDGPEHTNDYGKIIHKCKDAGFIALGYSNTFQTSISRIVKYTDTWDLEWVKEVSNLSYQAGICDSIDNIIITGISGLSNNNIVTVKFDSLGNVLWTKEYDRSNFEDHPKAIGVDYLGNVYITGHAQSGPHYYTRDIVTIKYNSDGFEEWIRLYKGSGYDAAYQLVIDNSNNIYVSGWSSGNDQDMIAIKYDNSGNQLWVNRYNGNGNYTDCVMASAIDNDNNYYVTGYIYKDTITGTDYCTIKYNSTGLQQWIKTYAGYGAGIDGSRCIFIDNLNNIYVTGSSWGEVSNYDIATIKYNSAGNEIWSKRYTSDGSREDKPHDIIVRDNSIFITANGYLSDYITLKYSQTVGINNVSSEIPKTFSLSQNYPNPFNPITNIKFDIPKSSFVSLTIYDMLGREVIQLVNEQLKAGTYQADWDATAFPSGVYFYKLESESFIETKKMILIK